MNLQLFELGVPHVLHCADGSVLGQQAHTAHYHPEEPQGS